MGAVAPTAPTLTRALYYRKVQKVIQVDADEKFSTYLVIMSLLQAA